jgi:Fuc2NAc and GlcNAc transferase
MTLVLLSVLFAAAGAFLVARCGARFGLTDRPNERSSHRVVMPKGGGIGILFAMILAGIVLGLDLGVILAAAGISVLSLFGDKTEIPPKVRLPLQFLFAGVALWSFDLQLLNSNGVFLLLLPVSLFFIVGTANFYNFMDGINGIAGITGVVAFGLLALFGHLHGAAEGMVVLPLCLAAACVGFLPFNMPRARVFMGDVGSVLLGFMFALLVIFQAGTLKDLLIMGIFLLPFYVDELTTMFLRLRTGENLLHAHRKHFYQLLANERGIPHWKVSIGYGAVQLVMGLVAITFHRFGTGVSFALFGAFFLILSLTRFHFQGSFAARLSSGK